MTPIARERNSPGVAVSTSASLSTYSVEPSIFSPGGYWVNGYSYSRGMESRAPVRPARGPFANSELANTVLSGVFGAVGRSFLMKSSRASCRENATSMWTPARAVEGASCAAPERARRPVATATQTAVLKDPIIFRPSFQRSIPLRRADVGVHLVLQQREGHRAREQDPVVELAGIEAGAEGGAGLVAQADDLELADLV